MNSAQTGPGSRDPQAGSDNPGGMLEQLAQESHESAERYRAIFETAVEGIITIDSSGIIESFNRAAEALFGYTASEVVGRNVNVLMPNPYHDEHDGYIADYLKTGHRKIIGIGREVTARKKDGSVFPIRLAVSEVRLPDRVIFTGFIEDLSERKAHELEAERWREELEARVAKRTEELAAANVELEHFAHTISHDLRTPLRGIRNYVGFLLEDLTGGISEESMEDLRGLDRAADELDRMIRDLLDYSRIGKTESAPEDVDLQPLIDDIAFAAAHDPGSEVVVSGPLPRLRASRGLLRQVFQNLIENGLRYNDSSPRRIEISARRLEGDPARWEILVRDNGIGIDPQYHERIFGLFKRLHSNDRYAGTGIGLAAAAKAVSHLGGAIRLESEPGVGSTFIVELPETAPPGESEGTP